MNVFCLLMRSLTEGYSLRMLSEYIMAKFEVSYFTHSIFHRGRNTASKSVLKVLTPTLETIMILTTSEKQVKNR